MNFISISDTSISTIVLNNTGDWLAIGCEGHGQLLVWEWQSETYVMKQQAHSSEISSLTYSSDSVYIATGGEDGKVLSNKYILDIFHWGTCLSNLNTVKPNHSIFKSKCVIFIYKFILNDSSDLKQLWND